MNIDVVSFDVEGVLVDGFPVVGKRGEQMGGIIGDFLKEDPLEIFTEKPHIATPLSIAEKSQLWSLKRPYVPASIGEYPYEHPTTYKNPLNDFIERKKYLKPELNRILKSDVKGLKNFLIYLENKNIDTIMTTEINIDVIEGLTYLFLAANDLLDFLNTSISPRGILKFDKGKINATAHRAFIKPGKTDGKLFEALKEYVGGKRTLHIDDNPIYYKPSLKYCEESILYTGIRNISNNSIPSYSNFEDIQALIEA